MSKKVKLFGDDVKKSEIKQYNKETNELIRKKYEETLTNMMSVERFAKLSFYSFMIAKCKVNSDFRVKTAGVSFSGLTYNLHIGKGFTEWTLEERMAVLVHEMRHILGGHTFRKGARNHRLFNYATDIAINQSIDNLPAGKINPETGKMEGGALYPSTFKFPENRTSEQYYELLLEEQKKQEKEKQEDQKDKESGDDKCDDCDGSGNQEKEDSESKGNGDSEESDEKDSKEESDEKDGGSGQEDEQEDKEPCKTCGGTGKKPDEWEPSNGNPNITQRKLEENEAMQGDMDSHEGWNGADDDDVEDVAKSVAEKMVKDAITSIDPGNMPGDIENILEMFKRKPVISWKKELKKILSSKKGSKIETIKKRNRRFPGRKDLRGRKRQVDNHEVLVGVDTSGSMSDGEILNALVEIYGLVKHNADDIKLIQIDTNIKSVEMFSEKSPTFTRRGYGGTYMGAIVEYIKEHKIKHDVLIMISDMHIENIDSDANWQSYKTPVIWLSSSGHIPEVKSRGHKIIDIENL